jgi:hypothetical protein
MQFEESLKLVTEFKRLAVEKNGVVVMGIDPGMTGALAFSLLSSDYSRSLKSITCDIPCTMVARGSGKKKSEYDHPGILGLLKPMLIANRKGKIEMHACVEKGHPNIGMMQRQKAAAAAVAKGFKPSRMFAGDTPITAFSMGWSGGMWPLFLESWEVKTALVKPSDWKRAMKLNKTDKEVSRQRAARQFPSLAARYLSAKSHHNRAEALLLIAYYVQTFLQRRKKK